MIYREDMLLKLIRVLGINIREADRGKSQTNARGLAESKLTSTDLAAIDPDESYVLTVDNLMKMLAIHMKFRYKLSM